MCIECGCGQSLPFGVKVLRAIAPSLVQVRRSDASADAPAADSPVGGQVSAAADSAVGRQLAAAADSNAGRQLAAAAKDGTSKLGPTADSDAAVGRQLAAAAMDGASKLGPTSASNDGTSKLGPTANLEGATASGPTAKPEEAAPAGTRHTLDLHTPLLAQNDRAAARNRALFAERRMLALNLVSSPGAGKTTLLARTVDEFGLEQRCAVVVGDLETDNDARRIHRPHVAVAQITTGTACHLDAEMVARGVAELPLEDARVLFIENVGNLVCPAAFDLGEAVRVVLLSATEGEDKPLKYPPIFKSAQLVLLTKIDVADVLGFDRRVAVENIRRIAPQATLIELSARSGEGMSQWYDYLRTRLPR